MAEFINHHPWMTFWLITLALIVADSIVANITAALGCRPEPKVSGAQAS